MKNIKLSISAYNAVHIVEALDQHLITLNKQKDKLAAKKGRTISIDQMRVNEDISSLNEVIVEIVQGIDSLEADKQ